MKKLSNTEAELKKSVAYKKKCVIEKAWCKCIFLNHFREANEQLL